MAPIAPSLTLENAMRTFEISFPELAFVAATRGMAGAGIGLLWANSCRRRFAGRSAGRFSP